MNNRRIDDLLAYLHALTKLDENDYKCYDEIGDVVSEIKAELGVGEGVLQHVATKKLIDELVTRVGVREVTANLPTSESIITIKEGDRGHGPEHIYGQVRIIVSRI